MTDLNLKCKRGDKMQITLCTEKDIDAVAEFYDKVTDYLAKTVNYPKWTPGVYPGKESTAEAIASREQYMCTENGRVVGAFIFNTDPKGAYEKGDWSREVKEGDYTVIHTLASDHELYGKGIGGLMVEKCIEMSRDCGFKAIRLDAVPGNFPAIKLYEKHGFTFAGEKDLERNIEGIPTFKLYEYNL